jgi:hypothetical protein
MQIRWEGRYRPGHGDLGGRETSSIGGQERDCHLRRTS